MLRKLMDKFLFWESKKLLEIGTFYAEKGGYENIKIALDYMEKSLMVLPDNEDGRAIRNYVREGLLETATKHSVDD